LIQNNVNGVTNKCFEIKALWNIIAKLALKLG